MVTSAPSTKTKKAKIHKDTTQAKAPGPGGDLSNAADYETFHVHVGILAKADAVVKAATDARKKARRDAIDSGIVMKELDLALYLKKQEPETADATIRRLTTYSKWLGLPIGTQGDMLNGDAAEDDNARAEAEGYEEGLQGVGVPEGPRYDMTTPTGQSRKRGWNKGQTVLQERFLKKNEEAKAEEKEKVH